MSLDGGSYGLNGYNVIMTHHNDPSKRNIIKSHEQKNIVPRFFHVFFPMAVPLSPGITGRGPPDFCQLDGGRVRRVNPGETANRKAGWLDRVGHLKDVPQKLGDFAGKKSPERSNRYFFIGNITLYHYCWGILGNIYIYIFVGDDSFPICGVDSTGESMRLSKWIPYLS